MSGNRPVSPAWKVVRAGLTGRLPGGTPGLSRSPWEQHPVVNDAEDFDHPVRRHAVDDQMTRVRHAVLGRDQPSGISEMKGAQSSDTRDLAGAGEGRGLAHGRRGCQYEAMVARRCGNAPAASALKQQCVDSIVGVTDEPVRH
jgi:hypothetical protein